MEEQTVEVVDMLEPAVLLEVDLLLVPPGCGSGEVGVEDIEVDDMVLEDVDVEDVVLDEVVDKRILPRPVSSTFSTAFRQIAWWPFRAFMTPGFRPETQSHPSHEASRRPAGLSAQPTPNRLDSKRLTSM